MITLSTKWAQVLISQAETGMGYQVASVYLRDGRRFEKAIIVGGQITSIGDDPSIPFTESDIAHIVVTHNK